MRAIIYILSIDHKYQNDPSETEEFKEELRKVVKDYNITFVGEEYANYNPSFPESSVKGVAYELKMGHEYCDLDDNERKYWGIPSKKEIAEKLGIRRNVPLDSREYQQIAAEEEKYHPILEEAWYQRPKDHIKEHEFLLFVCGETHRKSFAKLLEREGERVDYEALTGQFRT